LHRLNEKSVLAGRLSLLAMDATCYLATLPKESYPDVIYIDPMHPERQKSALVKKEMQVLQQLITAQGSAKDLLQMALIRTKNRVVVKWPQRLLPLLKPDFSFAGKTVRFDVYSAKRLIEA
ncbi:MAG: SAM-dependent methyltransferase, partial [Gammaproteobacteria bacterium]|nr:SAM-dependent methyltransferase [Gammaproteobacteria bacterium]